MMSAAEVASNLTNAFGRFCSSVGPSVSPEIFGKLEFIQQCGSLLPRTEIMP